MEEKNKKLIYDICLIIFVLVHLLIGLLNVGGFVLKDPDGVDGDGKTLAEGYAGLLIFLIYFPSMCIVLCA